MATKPLAQHAREREREGWIVYVKFGLDVVSLQPALFHGIQSIPQNPIPNPTLINFEILPSAILLHPTPDSHPGTTKSNPTHFIFLLS